MEYEYNINEVTPTIIVSRSELQTIICGMGRLQGTGYDLYCELYNVLESSSENAHTFTATITNVYEIIQGLHNLTDTNGLLLEFNTLVSTLKSQGRWTPNELHH